MIILSETSGLDSVSDKVRWKPGKDKFLLQNCHKNLKSGKDHTGSLHANLHPLTEMQVEDPEGHRINTNPGFASSWLRRYKDEKKKKADEMEAKFKLPQRDVK